MEAPIFSRYTRDMTSRAPFGPPRISKPLGRVIVVSWLVLPGVGLYFAVEKLLSRSPSVSVVSEYRTADGVPYRMVGPWLDPDEPDLARRVENCENWLIKTRANEKRGPERFVGAKFPPEGWTHVRTFCTRDGVLPTYPKLPIRHRT